MEGDLIPQSCPLTYTYMPCQRHESKIIVKLFKQSNNNNKKKMLHLSRNWEMKLKKKKDTTRHLRVQPCLNCGESYGNGSQFPAPMASVPTRAKGKDTRLAGKSSSYTVSTGNAMPRRGWHVPRASSPFVLSSGRSFNLGSGSTGTHHPPGLGGTPFLL